MSSAAIKSYVHKPVDEMESIWRGSYFRARGELGVEAFGLGVMDLPPDFDRIPRHVHTFDGQEEVYIPLKGGGWIDIGDHRVPINTGTGVRVGPTASRTVISGPEGLRVLIAGGTPGKAYQPFEPLELGAPEPNPAELPGVKADEFHESTEDYVAIPIESCGSMTAEAGDITFYPLGRALGASAFGLALIELRPTDGEGSYPLHVHEEDDQTEVFVIESGSGRVEIDGESIDVAEGEMVAINPGAQRKWFAGDEGLRLIALGAPAGKPYEGNKPTIKS